MFNFNYLPVVAPFCAVCTNWCSATCGSPFLCCLYKLVQCNCESTACFSRFGINSAFAVFLYVVRFRPKNCPTRRGGAEVDRFYQKIIFPSAEGHRSQKWSYRRLRRLRRRIHSGGDRISLTNDWWQCCWLVLSYGNVCAIINNRRTLSRDPEIAGIFVCADVLR